MTVDTFRAMGTTFEVHAPSAAEHGAVRGLVEQDEQRFSRFLAASELSRINDSTDRVIEISDDMRSVLTSAGRMRDLTGGLVEVGVGQAVRMWGYDAPIDEIAEPKQAPSNIAEPRWHLNDRGICLGQGTNLDLGGIAKGWTCDRIVSSGLASMMSAGGDLRSTDASLIVGIVDHHDREVAEIEVGVGALATSSRMKRRWALDQGEAHHLIDPRSMRPAITPITSATIVAATAVEAEAGAKAVLLLGDKGLAWADRQPWIRQALAIWHDGSVYATKARQAA